MQPIVHGLEETYSDQIEFIYLNIDDPNTAQAQRDYGFRVQPHFILLDANGEVVQQWFGYNSANVFEDAFNNLLAN